VKGGGGREEANRAWLTPSPCVPYPISPPLLRSAARSAMSTSAITSVNTLAAGARLKETAYQNLRALLKFQMVFVERFGDLFGDIKTYEDLMVVYMDEENAIAEARAKGREPAVVELAKKLEAADEKELAATEARVLRAAVPAAAHVKHFFQLKSMKDYRAHAPLNRSLQAIMVVLVSAPR
jgi:hypothetical protein